MSSPEFTETVREAARDRADGLFRLAWGEPVQASKREWRARETSARVMQMRGGKRGLWKDHKSGEGGDILDFVAVQFCGLGRARQDFPRVIREAAKLCGVAANDAPPDLAGFEARRAARMAQDAREADREARRKAELVAALVARCEPLEGSPAAAYLAGRAISDQPPCMAYLPPVPGLGVKHPQLPALVAWAIDETGAFRGGQRILLNLDGSPAGVETRKPAFGEIGGFPCRLPGRPTDPLVICEGPETAASIWQATGFETWAVFGASGFQSAPVPLGRKVLFAPDRDAPGSPAAEAFDRACLHHDARGVDLFIAHAPELEGSKRDLNDTLQRAGQLAVFEAVKGAVKFAARDSRGRFTGAGAVPLDAPAQMPDFVTAEEAERRIREGVRDFLERAARWQEAESDEPPPVLAIAPGPGAGKSRIAREVLAAFDLSRIGGDAVFMVPTLPLAEEAAAHSAELGGGSHVTRGRSAKAPGTEQAMCARPELAERVAKAGLRVKPTLCSRQDPDTGELAECPHAAGCAYLRQWQSLPPEQVLRFEASTYLSLPGDGSERETGIRVIDEKVFHLFNRTADLPLDAWTRGRTPRAARTEAQRDAAARVAADATRAAGEVLSALQMGRSPVLTGYTAEDFEAFAGIETPPDVLGVAPSASDEAIAESLAAHEAFDPDAGKRAALWRILAECKRQGLGTSERVQIVRDVPSSGTGERRDVIRLTWFAEPPRDKPVLVLDADADPLILERLWPGAEVLRFDLRPNAEAVQATDRTFSNGTLKRPEARREVAELVRFEVHRDRLNGGRGVLAIATRKAVRAMFEDAGHRFEDMGEDDVSTFMRETPLHGARWLWFGPASLGRNDWRDFGTAVVIGREEIPLDALEDDARALFGDTGEPLALVQPGEDGKRILPETVLPVTMADGSAWGVKARAHPDPRVRALQMQRREQATRQAFERLRLATATEPKRVVLACKVPIPGLPVSELVRFEDLRPSRLQAAMAEAAQRGGVLRLSAAGLAEDAPQTFPTAKAAEGWLAREGRTEIKYPRAANKGSISGTGVFNPVRVSLRLEGQRGRPTPALVVLPGDARAMAEAQLGPLAAFEVEGGKARAAPAETVVPADAVQWRKAERFAQEAARQARESPPAPQTRQRGSPAVAAQSAPAPAPERRLVWIPEAERSPVVLGEPQSRYRVEPARVRLTWARGMAERVAGAFARYQAMSESDPEAWT